MSFFRFLWENPVWILVIYLAAINLALFCTMAIDKALAKKDARRVPEATLFLLCLLGGGIGGIAGMWLCRHKTRHISFVVGFPVILLLEIALAVFLIVKF